MSNSNRGRIGEMLHLIEVGGGPLIEKHLKTTFGSNWRNHARLPKSLSPQSDLDAHALLYSITNNWREVFEAHLKPEMRDAASAVFAGRNKWAHGAGDIEDNLTLRALLGAVDLLKGLGAKKEAEAANALTETQQKEMTRKIFEKEGKLPSAGGDKGAKPQPTLTLTSPKGPTPEPDQPSLPGLGGGAVENLTPWRIACPPRDDVLEGRLHKDSFAADLAAADREEGSETYSDPLAFFNATHITNGLSLTLKNAAKRLGGDGGPSTIGLQTNFGGGKTHTLLSLLHMCRVKSFKDVENLSVVEASVSQTSFSHVKTAVFVGTDKGPDMPLANIGKKPIRTLWGFLAWRLLGDEGMKLVAAADEAGTNPGAEVFTKVFEKAGSSLILLDELVAYVRQLSGERYEAHLSFLQSLTEAASRSKTALIVGSLPESDLEAGGGDKGVDTLRRLEKLFGRTQSAWQPAQGSETYAVIRRRLFQELDTNGEKARKRTIEAFRKLYRDNKGDFPTSAGEKDYETKLEEAYPIHPMLFDKLSTEWGGLEKFQRTRGVLSLLARNIYASYRDRSDEPLILPSSLRMNDPEVRGALIEPLNGPVWGSIIDGEVDGDTSLPVRMETSKPRYRNEQVVRRAARAVFVCTAPRGDSRGGLTGPEIRLACATPGEQISIFGDALRELSERAGFLYEADGRYWFGSQPTLNKMVENRASDIDAERIDAEIVNMLRKDEGAGKGGWSFIHTAPIPATDVEDRPLTRLVLLPPSLPHTNDDSSPAEQAALDAVSRRSGGQRRFRNALVFLAADHRALDEARRTVRRMLAWQDVEKDSRLDLKESQRADAGNRAAEARRGATQAVRKAWSQLLAPYPSAQNGALIEIDRLVVKSTGQAPAAEAAWQKAAESNAVLKELGRASFVDRLKNLWPEGRDEVELDSVRDWFFEFPHMDRLRDEQVLANAVSAAVADLSNDGLGLAAGKNADGSYVSVAFQKSVEPRFGVGALLLTHEAAVKQIEAEKAPVPSPGSPQPSPSTPRTPVGPLPTTKAFPKRFVGVVELDPLRGLTRASQVFETVIGELERASGSKVRVTLEVHAESEQGFEDDIAGVVADNAKTLGFTHSEFE